MWIKDLNWEREMPLMCFHVTAITVRLPEANQLRQALTASKLCLIWCVHTEQWERLQRTQLLSHPFWFMPGLGIWLPLPIRLIFFSIAKRSGVYKNKGKAHLFQLSPDLSFCIKRKQQQLNSRWKGTRWHTWAGCANMQHVCPKGHPVSGHTFSPRVPSSWMFWLPLEGKPLCIHGDEGIKNGFNKSPE